MVRVSIRAGFVLALLLPMALASAEALQVDQTFSLKLFGRPLGKNTIFACFARSYSADHLAHHPEQNVRVMKLLVKGVNDGPSYHLGLSVSFRGRKSPLETTGDCGSLHDEGSKTGDTVHCGVACDGGLIDVTLKGKDSVLVAIPDGARMGVDEIADGTEFAREPKRFGADDKIFRLDRTSLADCMPLADDEAEKAALRRQ